MRAGARGRSGGIATKLALGTNATGSTYGGTARSVLEPSLSGLIGEVIVFTFLAFYIWQLYIYLEGLLFSWPCVEVDSWNQAFQTPPVPPGQRPLWLRFRLKNVSRKLHDK